ncbi:hypothetical protein NDU88_001925 [Pleurodeles waltl]|uniref:Uncharacterized protein n=1 Tax=Pleurodeles waltl TaxID=8319 RepID=A0AAV7U9G9_PLEWA|nr:hypothetical protein NDU88_001925 [Pleurodeles waltl]
MSACCGGYRNKSPEEEVGILQPFMGLPHWRPCLSFTPERCEQQVVPTDILLQNGSFFTRGRGLPSQDGGRVKRWLRLGLTLILLKLLPLGDRKRGSHMGRTLSTLRCRSGEFAEPGEASCSEREEAPTEGLSMSLECGAHA